MVLEKRRFNRLAGLRRGNTDNPAAASINSFGLYPTIEKI
jgi:hypothetical protein